MKQGKWMAAAVGSLLVAMAAGCADARDAQIKALTADNQRLGQDKKDLQAQITAANERETGYIQQIGAKDRELADKNAQIEGLRKQIGQPEDANQKTATGWTRTAFGDSVTVGSDILFDAGKATFKAAGTSALDKIAKDIASHYSGMVVRVYGHTDPDPIKKSGWDDNLELSANRAMAVTRYLIKKGVNPHLIETVAMGEYHPDPNAKDKAKQRRVEIFVVRSK